MSISPQRKHFVEDEGWQRGWWWCTPGLLVNNGRVWNDGVASLLGDKYKKIEGLPTGRAPAHTHKSLRLKALVTALLELIAHTHDDDDANDESEDEKDKIMMIIEDLPSLGMCILMLEILNQVCVLPNYF